MRPFIATLLLFFAATATSFAQPTKDDDWVKVTEDDRAIKIETDKLEAVMMVIDWLKEADSADVYHEKGWRLTK